MKHSIDNGLAVFHTINYDPSACQQFSKITARQNAVLVERSHQRIGLEQNSFIQYDVGRKRFAAIV